MSGFFNNLYNTHDNKKFLTCAASNDFPALKQLFDRSTITTQEANNIIDAYHNNLLHLATMNNNPDMVHFLLKQRINYNKKNRFDKSPWELALQFQHNPTIQEYINHQVDVSCEPIHSSHRNCSDKIQNLTSDLATLTTILESHKNCDSTINQLLDTNKEFAKTNAKLREENSSLTQSRKRQHIEIENLTFDNNKLRIENDDLIQANKKLKTSVDNLIKQNRKK